VAYKTARLIDNVLHIKLMSKAKRKEDFSSFILNFNFPLPYSDGGKDFF